MAYRPALPPSALNHLRPGVHYVVTTVAGDRVSGAYGGIEVEQDDWSLLLAGPDRYESVRIDRVGLGRPALITRMVGMPTGAGSLGTA